MKSLLRNAFAKNNKKCNAIQPTHPLSPPSPPVLNPSQHQGLFQWVGSLHQVAKVLELQHQSYQWIFRIDFLYNWLIWYSHCPRDSQENSPTSHLKSINSLAFSLFYRPTLILIHDYWKNHSFSKADLFWQSNVCAFLHIPLSYVFLHISLISVAQW